MTVIGRIGLAGLAFALCLLGSTPEPRATGEPVRVLTYGPLIAVWACCEPHAVGTLLPDRNVGTVLRYEVADNEFQVIPVSWPPGSTGRWSGPEVVVLDAAGMVIARTGGRYTCWQDALPERNWHCEPWATGDPLPLRRLPGSALRLAAAKLEFRAVCEAPSVVRAGTCALIDIDGMHGGGDNVFVPLLSPRKNRDRGQSICHDIAAALDGFDGRPLGFRIVVIEGRNGVHHLGVCDVT